MSCDFSVPKSVWRGPKQDIKFSRYLFESVKGNAERHIYVQFTKSDWAGDVPIEFIWFMGNFLSLSRRPLQAFAHLFVWFLIWAASWTTCNFRLVQRLLSKRCYPPKCRNPPFVISSHFFISICLFFEFTTTHRKSISGFYAFPRC